MSITYLFGYFGHGGLTLHGLLCRLIFKPAHQKPWGEVFEDMDIDDSVIRGPASGVVTAARGCHCRPGLGRVGELALLGATWRYCGAPVGSWPLLRRSWWLRRRSNLTPAALLAAPAEREE